MVAPLLHLADTARALGRGDLSVRTGILREDEVGELARAFDDMAARIERLVRNEKELLANVSHELRTPMARIRFALELAAGGDGEEARRYLGEIGTDLSELERLVEDVLTSARLDLEQGRAGDGTLVLHRAPTGLQSLIDHAVQRFRTAYPDRELQLDLVPPLPEIDVDPVLLRRVIDNLLDNARKYADPSQPIVLAAGEVGGEAWLEVRDRGPGIAPEDLPHLFSPFFRADRSRARGTGGVGLGLTLAKRVVEAHGGRIAASSVVGEGTTIRFGIPILPG
jgi:signal transduction histidine kinase